MTSSEEIAPPVLVVETTFLSRTPKRDSMQCTKGRLSPVGTEGHRGADLLAPLSVTSETLSVDGANERLRAVIDRSRASGAPHQNQDSTRIIKNIFSDVR
jgi:hypothetical protein